MQIKLTAAIRHCSVELPAGAQLELPDGEAQQLIAAGFAVAVKHSHPTNPSTSKGK